MACFLQAVFIVCSASIYGVAWRYSNIAGALSRPELRQLIGTCVLMIVFLWTLKTGIQPGLDVHFLGLTAVTLMLGWRLSIVVAPIALLILTALGIYSWQAIGVNLFLGMLLPICFTYLFFLLTRSEEHT